MPAVIALLDYGAGNVRSVHKALIAAGGDVQLASTPDKVMLADAVVLPGVGAFDDCINAMQRQELLEATRGFIASGKPFLGVCVGYQALFEKSEEFGSHSGLGIIKGSVRKFQFYAGENTKSPVPQIGWNKIRQNGSKWNETPLCKNRDNDFMYFVHSYYVEPDNKQVILSTTTYGDREYCSAIQYNNIFATQFHPEKSGSIGMKIYQQLKIDLDK